MGLQPETHDDGKGREERCSEKGASPSGPLRGGRAGQFLGGSGSLEGKTVQGREGRQAPTQSLQDCVGLAEDLWLTPLEMACGQT